MKNEILQAYKADVKSGRQTEYVTLNDGGIYIEKEAAIEAGKTMGICAVVEHRYLGGKLISAKRIF